MIKPIKKSFHAVTAQRTWRKLRTYWDFYPYWTGQKKKEIFLILISLILLAYFLPKEIQDVRTELSDFLEQITTLNFNTILPLLGALIKLLALLSLFFFFAVKVLWEFRDLTTSIAGIYNSRYVTGENGQHITQCTIAGYPEIKKISFHSRTIPIAEIQPPKNFHTLTHTIRSDNKSYEEYAYYSPLLNEYIASNKQLPFQYDQKKELELTDHILENEETLIPFLYQAFLNNMTKGKYFTNEKKICLSADIVPDTESICHKGGYYDSYITNEVCTKKLLHRTTGDILIDGTMYFPIEERNNSFILTAIEDSIMNQHIGVSTLCFTKDNYFITKSEEKTNLVNAGLVSVAGSGSLDWKDILWKDKSQGTGELRATVIHGMQRELHEEMKIDYGHMQQTKLFGFFRWVIRGGKPEFVGITKLSKTLEDITRHNKEVLSSPQITTIAELDIWIDATLQDKEISLPYFVCLQTLKQQKAIVAPFLNLHA